MRNLVKSENSTAKELFPFDKPFVAFYSFSTLLACLIEEGIEDKPNQGFISHSMKLLVSFLIADQLSDPMALNRNQFYLASVAVECLLDCIAICDVATGEISVAEDNAAFAKKLHQFIEAGRALITTNQSYDTVKVQKLICNSFGVLLEGSFRDHLFWNAVKQELNFTTLIQALLLKESRQSIRVDVSERIRRACSSTKAGKVSQKDSDSNEQTTSIAESPIRIDMLATIWEAFIQSISVASKYASQSAEFFKVVIWGFRAVVDRSPQDIVLSEYLRQWSQVMLNHETVEVGCAVTMSWKGSAANIISVYRPRAN